MNKDENDEEGRRGRWREMMLKKIEEIEED